MKYLLILIALAACGDSPKLPVDTLQDPNTCAECHMSHFTQWSGSMHAYSSDDPVFLAMNKRGQRDTNGQLGAFCLQCHAPMAVTLKIYDDSNAASFDPTTLPAAARGITCYFCHDVKAIADDHNNGLQLALDDNMRGGVHDPVESPAHNSSYDTKMDGYTNKSQMCGSCHDVVTPAGVHLERSYTEWQGTVFAMDDPAHHLPVTCSGCHMKSDPNTTVIADKPGLNVKSREASFHLHTWPAIDQAFAPFPDTDALAVQAAGIKDILDPALTIIGPRPIAGGTPPGGICLDPPGTLTVRMDTISTGHMFPSGAAQDRRSWLEVIAYDASNTIVFSSGSVPDNKDPEDITDPNLTGFWDRTMKSDGTQAHFFWDVATYQSKLLKPAVTLDPMAMGYDHSTTATFNVATQYASIDHITARVRTRPFAYSMLDQLVSSGDLEAPLATSIKTLDSFGGTAAWTKATKGMGIGSMNTNCNPNPPL
jgi:hypothetical protein